jgi:hypothetical protein
MWVVVVVVVVVVEMVREETMDPTSTGKGGRK